ncbi:MAG: porphobilinogen deaminase [Candidatus Xenobia bacterium]
MLVRLGTRGSELALAQSMQVARQLESLHPGLRVETLVIKTTGDQKADVPLSSLGGKGAFTREIEHALLGGQVDLAVHSLKDLPTTLPEGLVLGAVPERQDPRDCLIASVPLGELPPGARVGTGSARRVGQLRQARPDLIFEGIRGNLPTRVAKWRRGEYQAIVLALAGLNRLGLEACGLEPHELHPLDPSVCLPAPGQGVLGLEIREHDEQTRALLAPLEHPESALAMRVERAFLAELEGNCSLPAGCLAESGREGLSARGVLGDAGGERLARSSAHDRDPERLGRELARQLKAQL